MTTLARWTRRDNFSVAAHQKLVDAVNEGKNLSVIGDLEVDSTPFGKTLIHTRRDTYITRYTAKIIEPETEDQEYTDCRYRCQILKVDANADPEARPAFTVQDDPGLYPEYGIDYEDVDENIGSTVTATNLAEYPDDTHSLVENGTVIVELYCEFDMSQPPKARWFFILSQGGKLRPVRLTADGEGDILVWNGTSFDDTGQDATDLYEVNQADGFEFDATDGTIVLTNPDGTFFASLRLLNDTTHIGYTAALIMDETLTSVFEFENVGGGAKIKYGGPTEQRKVLQINSLGQVVAGWVEGH